MANWTHVQGAGIQGSGTSVATSFVGAVTSGDVVCGVLFLSTASDVITSITDDKGNAYNQSAGTYFSGGPFGLQSFWGGPSSNKPTTVTINFSSSQSFAWVLIDEFIPPFTGAIVADGSNAASSGSAITSSGNFTTINNNDLVYSGFVSAAAGSAGAGFTFLQGLDANLFASEFMIQSIPGTTAGTWTGATGATAITAFALSSFGPAGPPLNQPSVFSTPMPSLVRRAHTISS